MSSPARQPRDRAQLRSEARARLEREIGGRRLVAETARDDVQQAAMRYFTGEADEASLQTAEALLAEAERALNRAEAALVALRAQMPV